MIRGTQLSTSMDGRVMHRCCWYRFVRVFLRKAWIHQRQIRTFLMNHIAELPIGCCHTFGRIVDDFEQFVPKKGEAFYQYEGFCCWQPKNLELYLEANLSKGFIGYQWLTFKNCVAIFFSKGGECRDWPEGSIPKELCGRCYCISFYFLRLLLCPVYHYSYSLVP